MAGPDRGLVAALTDRPIIQNVTWTDAPSNLDLRGTGLNSLSVSGTIDLLQLPDELTTLTLLDGVRAAAAADYGRSLDLQISSLIPAHIPADGALASI